MPPQPALCAGEAEHNVKVGEGRKEGNPAHTDTKAKGTQRPEPLVVPCALTNMTHKTAHQRNGTQMDASVKQFQKHTRG